MIPKHSQSKTPTHTSPTQEDRTAHAPYNFVALPKQAQPVDSPVAQVDQSRYDDALLTGQIQCEFETKSPLYTRCLMSPEFFREYGDKKFHELTQAQREERAQFYQQHSNPVVPGSSLRGMIRTLVEIISFGKFLDVTDKQLVFRAVAEGKNTTALGAYYSKLAKNGMAFKAKAGYMTQNNGIWHICPASVINGVSFARVKCDATRIFSLPKHKNSCNAYGPIYFAPNPVASGKNMLVTTVQDKKAADLQAGVLVKSGKMGGKKHDYIVFSSDATQTLIEIPFELEQNYRQQISREQRELLQGFDKHDEAIGVLQVDQPVFYLTYEDKLVYFGHLPLMRLPYEKKPLDLVPKPLRSPTHIDLAEKLFGYVGKGNKGKYEQDALAGRVFFSDAVLAPDQTNVWYSDKPVVPQILSGPKPTSFQLYLTQQQPDDKLKLQHYDSSDTTLRGYKLYWHKGEKPAFEEKKDEMDVIDEKTWTIRNESGQPVPDTQHTLIKPVKAGVKFTFTIRFENLHPVELGALLWAIEPTPFARNRSICHKLGMGKPLGLGSIQIFDVQVKVDDRVQRYQSLFDENGWAQPERGIDNCFDNYRKQFEAFMSERINDSFSDSERIKQLRRLMTWEGPSETEIDYQQIEPKNEFKDRPVLPLPEDIALQKVQSTHAKDEKPLTRIDNLQDVQVGAKIRVNVISADPDAAFLEPMDKGTAVENGEIELFVERPHTYKKGNSNVLVEVIKIEGSDPVTLFCKPSKTQHPSE